MNIGDYVKTPDNIIFKIDYITNHFISNNRVTKGYRKDECILLTEEQIKIVGLK